MIDFMYSNIGLKVQLQTRDHNALKNEMDKKFS